MISPASMRTLYPLPQARICSRIGPRVWPKLVTSHSTRGGTSARTCRLTTPPASSSRSLKSDHPLGGNGGKSPQLSEALARLQGVANGDRLPPSPHEIERGIHVASRLPVVSPCLFGTLKRGYPYLQECRYFLNCRRRHTLPHAPRPTGTVYLTTRLHTQKTKRLQ
ncbi:MAG: hypothetical protein ACI9C2_001654 [Gammaproteobacteria bacterium]